MRIKVFLLGVLLSALAAHAQVAPSSVGNRTTLTVGAGFSDFAPDYGASRLLGVSVWSDWTVYRGLGLEVEGKTLQWNGLQIAPYPTQLRQDNIAGGPRYQFRRFGRLQPYVKGLIGFGSIDFPTHTAAPIHHNTYGMAVFGGGLDYKLTRRIYVRGDYEYESWPSFGRNGLTPNGFTIGASYRIW